MCLWAQEGHATPPGSFINIVFMSRIRWGSNPSEWSHVGDTVTQWTATCVCTRSIEIPPTFTQEHTHSPTVQLKWSVGWLGGTWLADVSVQQLAWTIAQGEWNHCSEKIANKSLKDWNGSLRWSVREDFFLFLAVFVLLEVKSKTKRS